jgi:hypothetical protein
MRRVAVNPADRFGIFVIPSDVSTNLPRKVRDRGEDAAREQVAFDLRKPEFDLVEPRGIRRREVQVHGRMVEQKGADRLGLVLRASRQWERSLSRSTGRDVLIMEFQLHTGSYQ